MDKEVKTLVESILKAQAAKDEAITKSWSQSGSATTGITAYNLEAPAKLLYPVLTPLRNDTPRIVGGTGIQANWKAVTALNTTNVGFGVSEGNRGAVQGHTVTDYNAAFRACGIEDYVTFEADFAAQGFQDVKALAAMGLLQSAMIEEEKFDLGGNTSIAFGTCGTPSLAAATTGGSVPSSTQVSVICVALSLEAYLNSSVTSGLPLSGNRTLPDGSTEAYNRGTSQKSSAATVTTGAGTETNKVTATVARVNGAVAYAWFWGASGSEVLGAITTTTSYVITTAAGTGTQAAASNFTADKSQNGLAYDGLLTQVFKSGSGAYVKDLAGATLTAGTDGSVVEIDTALQSFWDNYRLSPDEIWVSAQEQGNITKKVLTGSTTAAQRFSIQTNGGAIVGATSVTSYRNKFSMSGAVEIPIKIHPFLPAGTILFRTKSLPYPLSGVPMVTRKLLRRDYYQIEWPLKTRKYEYGVYFDGLLQNYFPPAFGVITNIANG